MKTKIFILTFLCLYTNFFPPITKAQTPIATWNFNEISNGTATEAVTNQSFDIQGNFAVEAVDGIDGKAWRLDGYTSYIEGDLPQEMPQTAFTFSTWLALDNYPSNTSRVGIFTIFDEETQRGLLVTMDRFGKVRLTMNISGTQYSVETREGLAKCAWHQVVATVDVEAQTMALYLNGELEEEKSFAGSELFWAATNTVNIGRHPVEEFIAVFPLRHFNGILDELQLLEEAMTASEVESQYGPPNTIPNLEVPDSRFADDFHRPIYHAIPPAGWTNEPHGLVYNPNTGNYHIFYQKNGNGPYHSQINWGHQSSPDLVTWTEHKPILSPELGEDNFGIWSGTSAVREDGTPIIIYTGVDGVSAQMMAAIGSEDMMTWEKYSGNPLVQNPPPNYATMDFRDPYVWKDEQGWNMIVGSGLVNTGGAMFLYQSEDLLDWEYIGPFKIDDNERDGTGIFWEMPVLLPFEGEGLFNDVFVFNPVPEPDKRARGLYYVGDFDGERFTPDFFNDVEAMPILLYIKLFEYIEGYYSFLYVE